MSRLIGKPLPRIEDRPLLLGKGNYAADCAAPGMVHMRVLRSPVARGRITHIDTADALELDGVIAVFTSKDVAHVPPISFRQQGMDSMMPYRQPILAEGFVRYVGEPVAAIIATDPYVAEDAEELVWVEYEELPPLLDAATDRGSFDDVRENIAAVIDRGYGDLEAAFAEASTIVELELRVGRHSGVPLETRGGLAVLDPNGVLRLLGAAKVPHYNRSAIAKMLKLDPDKLILSEGHVGGGFGVRGELYPEDVLLCFAALELRRPVKWVEDRREHLVATNHSRDQVHRVRAAVDENGYILAVDDEFFLDQGGYVRTHAASVPNVGVAMLAGPYVWPAFRVRCNVVLTNKTPAGTYRSPGRYEGTFVRERLMDAVAAKLDLSPIEVRRRNLIKPEQMPFSREVLYKGGSLVLDSGDYPGLLKKALDAWQLDTAKAASADRSTGDEAIGVGLAMFVEKSGPASVETVRIELTDEAKARVITGAGSVGQGIETIIAQICAEELGLELDDVSVIHGQTDLIARGMGVFGSRVTVLTGSATEIAAQELKTKLLSLAAEHLGRTGDLTLDGKQIVVDGSPLISVQELLQQLPGGAPLVAEGTFETHIMTHPYGIHAAEVAVDRETGAVDVRRLWIAYDVGRAINPLLIKGQLVGGAAQGIGGALYEDFSYDDEAQPTATSFMDYLIPTASEMPKFDILLTEDAPSRLNPLGVKGAGEGGITAVGAAIAAAIDDALQQPMLVTQLPATPERVLHGSRNGKQGQ
jgi:aerobic carbon-monoxide dehydrogenase large subunit